MKTFFCSSLNFGQKIGLILGRTISDSDLVLLKFSEVPAPPSFQNPAYATDFASLNYSNQESWQFVLAICIQQFVLATVTLTRVSLHVREFHSLYCISAFLFISL